MIFAGFKLSEPVTLFTDGFLGIQCLCYTFFLFRHKSQSSSFQKLLPWLLGFLNLGIFAINGAISHFTTSESIYRITWPMCVIFGGLAILFFQYGLIYYNLDEDQNQEKKIPTPHLILPFLGYLIYFIILYFQDWAFSIFSFYLVYFLLYFLYSFFVTRIDATQKTFHIKILKFLFFLLIFGVIQVIGKAISWNYYFGPNDQYLFQVGNEIFHIGIVFPVWYLYRVIKKEFLHPN
jgi:Family of unknown function (DUF6962)